MNEDRRSQIALTVSRILLSLIFLVAGFQHLLNPNHVALRISKTSWAEFLAILMPLNIHAFMAGVVLVIGGLGLFFGSKTRLSALALMAVLIPITITVQTDSADTLGPLFKNIAIFSGLIYFAQFGIGQGFGIDRVSFKGKSMALYFSATKILVVAIFSGLLAPSLFHGDFASAATQGAIGKDVAILVQKERHMRVAIETLVKGQAKGSSPYVRAGVVVVCGKEGVMALKKDSKSKEQIQNSKSAGLKIVACGLSLKEAGLKNEDLLVGVDVVENGLWEIIRLQAAGYTSVEL